MPWPFLFQQIHQNCYMLLILLLLFSILMPAASLELPRSPGPPWFSESLPKPKTFDSPAPPRPSEPVTPYWLYNPLIHLWLSNSLTPPESFCPCHSPWLHNGFLDLQLGLDSSIIWLCQGPPSLLLFHCPQPLPALPQFSIYLGSPWSSVLSAAP